MGYGKSLGYPDNSPYLKTFLGTPIRYRGEHVGNLLLANKSGEAEFNQEDEETLEIFATRAALGITNSWRHRDEQRARADLETLVNTVPVGVVVFNARTGTPLSFNQEAVRIIEDLQTPGRPPEHLIEVLTIRRADG